MMILHFVPDELTDEAAAQMLEYLYGLAGAFENQYFAQICRYYEERRGSERACHHGQLELFVNDDVTF